MNEKAKCKNCTDEMIEEMASDIYWQAKDCDILTRSGCKDLAKILVNANYRNCKDKVVLDRQEYQKYCAYKIIESQIKGCLDRERELESENESCYEVLATSKSVIKQQDKRIAELEEYIEGNANDAKAFVENWHNDLKKELKNFAERVKMEFYYEFDELIPSIMEDKIDKLLEEWQGE